MKTVKLTYHAFGDSAAPPLLVLHGLFASSRNWQTLAKRFAERYHVFVLDLRNHGASPHAPEMDYPHMAEDVRRFLDERGLSKASLLGHSMGGKVAMWLALSHPDRVDRLIVADIAPVTYEHPIDDVMSALKELPLDRIGNRKEAEQWLAERIEKERLRLFLLQNLYYRGHRYHWRLNLEALERGAEAILGFPEVEEGRRFAGDALFLGGAYSQYIGPEHLPLIRQLFPNARLEFIPGAGHWLHVEQPDAFVKMVLGAAPSA